MSTTMSKKRQKIQSVHALTAITVLAKVQKTSMLLIIKLAIAVIKTNQNVLFYLEQQLTLAMVSFFFVFKKNC